MMTQVAIDTKAKLPHTYYEIPYSFTKNYVLKNVALVLKVAAYHDTIIEILLVRFFALRNVCRNLFFH